MLDGGVEMKKAMMYICALTLAFSALLSGCGEISRPDGGAAAPTATPEVTVLPESMMPDAADGEVRDRDGIITDGDTGSGNGNVLPETGTGNKTENGTGTGTLTAAKR